MQNLMLEKIGYYDALRQIKNIENVTAKSEKLNFNVFFMGSLIVLSIGFMGGIFIHDGFLFAFILIFGLFLYMIEKDASIKKKYKKELSSIYLTFFDKIQESPEQFKEIAKLCTDDMSHNMFLSIVDNFVQKKDKEDLLKNLRKLVKYNESLSEQQSNLTQRDSFLSSLNLPVQKREAVDEKSYQNKARERVLEML